VSAGDGHIIWNTEVFQAEPAEARALNPKNSLASPTPLVRGNRLYAHFGHLGTAALDLSGKVLWRQTSLHYPPTHGNGGSPALVGDLLVFSCDGGEAPFIVALDANTGKVRWKTTRQTPARNTFSFSTPLDITVRGTPYIISAGSGLVGAYDPLDGHEVWRARYGEGYSVVPRPVFGQGLLFVCIGFDQPGLYAIRPDGAHGDVTDSHVAWRIARGAPLTPSPLLVGDELYLVADDGMFTRVEASTGRVRWGKRLRGNFSASPVYADGHIYLQNEVGVGYVANRASTFQLLATNDVGERTLASYAVVDNALIIRSESHLWRIGK
jgi:outer membrane protein assembly factor BamB